jgi:hypothetical protein
MLLWPLADGVTFDGLVDMESIADFTSPGYVGDSAPACLNVWPHPSGFWHSDLLQVGLTVPAPYLFGDPTSLSCVADAVVAYDGNRDRVASTCTWHESWTPLHPLDGPTRCGVMTVLRESHLAAALSRYQRELRWIVELRVWKQAREYEPFELTTRYACVDR